MGHALILDRHATVAGCIGRLHLGDVEVCVPDLAAGTSCLHVGDYARVTGVELL